ncbi:uncharacterized protein LOC127808045 [Diospyros lotus]|uniref:uncharacterized protein LOC127808045 n=1 Tax=Diospyros lotus TaxID=55363 RepID=UPI002251A855|nr:uncharacterized protein LOC127808045 [Diospyros lotus]
MSGSSPRFFSYIKLRFFARIRWFLEPKASMKRHTASDRFEKPRVADSDQEERQEEQVAKEREGAHQDGGLVVLRRAVKKLHFGSWEEKAAAADEIRRLAEEDLKLRKWLAELGVVPPLVAMIGSEVGGGGRWRFAVQALVALANGTYTNKALIVEAGILLRLPSNVEDLEEAARQELAQLLLSLSSLATSQFPLSSSKLLPFLFHILDSDSSLETKNLCLATLHNLSTMFGQAGNLVSHGILPTLLRLSSVQEVSEKALATLGNLVVSLQGKKAMENHPMVPESLIEILTWEEKPRCQELSAYILMILAHQSSRQREKMVEAGIVQVLLEVALLGSCLAQKRALKLLQWFKDGRRAKMGPHSGPQTGRVAVGSPVNQWEADEGRKIMKMLVKQSLYKNMETITRRANAALGSSSSSSSKLKALVVSSSSKSLPY